MFTNLNGAINMTKPARPLRKHKAVQDRMVTIKVSLRGAKPPIWRRLVIKASSTLADLDFAIQSSMVAPMATGACWMNFLMKTAYR